MGPFSRREFLERSAILSAAVAVGAPAVRAADEPAAKRGSASDRLRVAVVGVRGRGRDHVNGFLRAENCDIVTICDCDEAVTGRALEAIKKAGRPAPKFEKDVRQVIDDPNVDVISIAAPNHWHALMAVWAMRAGKDVYCEKPATHNVREGRLMTEAARRYNRLCQVGTQSRSNPGMREAIQYIHDGHIGKVSLAYGTCYKRRPSIGDTGRKQGPQKPPATMDYDLWCGPARVLPPRRKTGNGTVHYDWHWIWEYGNGDFGNQGVHECDKARWGLGAEAMPRSVMCVGGRFGYVDDGETPNTQLALYEYPDADLIFEVRGLPTDGYKGAKVGNIWFGDKGYVVCPNYSSGIAHDPDGKVVKRFSGGGDQHHFNNFVRAVRSRKSSDLHCDAFQGHLSAALCHLANISYRLGRETPFSTDLTAVTDDQAATEALTRMKEHLTANQVDLSQAVGRVGPKLAIDPQTEQFTGGSDVAKANEMLFREYRKGFDITEAM